MEKKVAIIRKNFFNQIAVNAHHIQFVLLIHIVKDSIEFINKIEKIGNIAVLIAIPYSLDEKILKKLKKYNIVKAKLEHLYQETYLFEIFKTYVCKTTPVILVEIGGYFAKIAQKISDYYSLLGIIEDTEFGHRKYLDIQHNLAFPVISVARSSLKLAEDALIGKSCIFAIEKILRNEGHILNAQTALVIGYGKIGSSVARTLRQHHLHVLVYDNNPIKRLLALSEGYPVPSKGMALRQAHFILGATGNFSITSSEYYQLKNNAILISCSSKQAEFDMKTLKNFSNKKVNNYLDGYYINKKIIYMMNDGCPINFSEEKSLVGTIISLIQAEIIMGIKKILEENLEANVYYISEEIRKELASQWLNYFCDEKSGTYVFGTN